MIKSHSTTSCQKLQVFHSYACIHTGKHDTCTLLEQPKSYHLIMHLNSHKLLRKPSTSIIGHITLFIML